MCALRWRWMLHPDTNASPFPFLFACRTRANVCIIKRELFAVQQETCVSCFLISIGTSHLNRQFCKSGPLVSPLWVKRFYFQGLSQLYWYWSGSSILTFFFRTTWQTFLFSLQVAPALKETTAMGQTSAWRKVRISVSCAFALRLCKVHVTKMTFNKLVPTSISGIIMSHERRSGGYISFWYQRL